MKRIALVLLAAASLVGCSSDDGGCNEAALLDFYDVTVGFEGFDEHVGQLFEARTTWVRDTMNEVLVPSIPSAEFSVMLTAVCDQPTYLEFYVDVNGNGDYDPPPTDHAWRMGVAGSNVIFQHDTNYVDIEW